MANLEKVTVPDIGGAEDVEVIEVSVAPGDEVKVDDPLITLESEKASMDVPAPIAGVIKSVDVKVGDKVSEGSLIVTVEAGADEPAKKTTKAAKSEEQPAASKKSAAAKKSAGKQAVKVPDIGGATDVEIIEVMVSAGDDIQAEQSLITLESEKASMDVPAPLAGKVLEVNVKVGDKVSEGDVILSVEGGDGEAEAEETPAAPVASAPAEEKVKQAAPAAVDFSEDDDEGDVHAGPGVRRIAREFGINLTKLTGSGAKGRIVKEDVQQYVKQRLQAAESGGGAGLAVAAAPAVDFSKFGEIEHAPLSKIKKISGANLHRNWVSIPHVTQFEDADITELEAFRKEQKGLAEKQGFKLTPLVFIMKAVVAALKKFPTFNASLSPAGDELILKKYFHIGVAVDTPNGLVVPVIRDVDQKGLFDLAKELGDISKKAREKGIGLAEMQGGCFTISSLGGIGGTAFTPIINAPEVAILGVSRSSRKPVFQANNQFEPRLVLPLSLSYDHRVIDGAEGARFIVYLAQRLADIRTLLL